MTPERVARGDRLARLTADITGCRACPRLVDWREHVAAHPRAAFADQAYWGRPVPGFGDPAATVVVVGLAPAAHGANRTGRMFTGDRTGDWLVAALHRTGLADRPTSTARDDGLRMLGTWLTAAVHCAPPDNRPSPQERRTCAPYLDRELALLPWRVAVALGSLGWDAVLGRTGWTGRKPRFGQGAEAVLPDGRVLLGSYHPSQQNTFTGRLAPGMLEDVLLRARARAAEPLGPAPGPVSKGSGHGSGEPPGQGSGQRSGPAPAGAPAAPAPGPTPLDDPGPASPAGSRRAPADGPVRPSD